MYVSQYYNPTHNITDYSFRNSLYPEYTPTYKAYVPALSSYMTKQQLPNYMQSTGMQNAQPNTNPTIGSQVKNTWGSMSIGEKANTIMGTVGTLLSAYNGFKANKLAKDQYNLQKATAERNWEAQRKTVNSQLEDRQRRRVEEAQANKRTETSVSDYMKKYGI